MCASRSTGWKRRQWTSSVGSLSGFWRLSRASWFCRGATPGGITVALLLGAAGALLGRFVVGLLGGAGATGFGTQTILWASLGALALLELYRLVEGLRSM